MYKKVIGFSVETICKENNEEITSIDDMSGAMNLMQPNDFLNNRLVVNLCEVIQEMERRYRKDIGDENVKKIAQTRNLEDMSQLTRNVNQTCLTKVIFFFLFEKFDIKFPM